MCYVCVFLVFLVPFMEPEPHINAPACESLALMVEKLNIFVLQSIIHFFISSRLNNLSRSGTKCYY